MDGPMDDPMDDAIDDPNEGPIEGSMEESMDDPNEDPKDPPLPVLNILNSSRKALYPSSSTMVQKIKKIPAKKTCEIK